MFSPVWSQDVVVGEARLATGRSLVGAFQSYEMCSKRFINSSHTGHSPSERHWDMNVCASVLTGDSGYGCAP